MIIPAHVATLVVSDRRSRRALSKGCVRLCKSAPYPCPNERQWLGHARRPNNGGLARLGILHETTPNHTALCALSKWQVKRAFGTGS
jgi:hypothetical protein